MESVRSKSKAVTDGVWGRWAQSAALAVSGGLLGAAFLAEWSGSLAWIALVPWLVVTRRSSALRGMLAGLVTGTVFGLVVSSWIPGSLRSLNASAGTATFVWLAAAAIHCGLRFAVVGAALSCARAVRDEVYVAAAASAWIGVDALQSYASPLIPWALLGHSQWNQLGVAQLATLGGVPLISGLVGATNAAVVVALRPNPRRGAQRTLAPAAAGAGMFLVLSFLGLPVAKWTRPVSEAPQLRLLVVQPNLPPDERWSRLAQRTNLQEVGELTRRAVANVAAPVDLVVWPETTLTVPIEEDSALKADLEEWASVLALPIVLGLVRPSEKPGHYRNSAIWLHPSGRVENGVDKTTRVPLGETGGFLADWLPPIRGPERGLRVEAASQDEPLRGAFELVVVFCYEAIFPGLVAARRTSESVAILILANDSWFSEETVSQLQLRFSLFRAIEERMWLVRAAHGGISALVDPLGRVVEVLPTRRAGTFVAGIAQRPPPTRTERWAVSGVALLGGAAGTATYALLRRKLT